MSESPHRHVREINQMDYQINGERKECVGFEEYSEDVLNHQRTPTGDSITQSTTVRMFRFTFEDGTETEMQKRHFDSMKKHYHNQP